MADAVVCIEIGTKYPFDASDNGRPRKPRDWAVVAARGVIANLMDRRGIKWAFQDIDHDTRKEIVDSLAEIIRLAAKPKETK